MWRDNGNSYSGRSSDSGQREAGPSTYQTGNRGYAGSNDRQALGGYQIPIAEASERSERDEGDDWREVILIERNEVEQSQKKHLLTKTLVPKKVVNEQRSIEVPGITAGSTKEIVIGRLNHLNKNFICVQNDMVSRTHCKITYVPNDLAPLSSKFCRLLHYRSKCGQWRAFSQIPNNVMRLIFSFMRADHGYYLKDLNSRNGTFIEIKSKCWRTLKSDSVYTLAGERYELRVHQILNNYSGWDGGSLYQNKVSQFLKKMDNNKSIKIPHDCELNGANRYKFSYISIRIKIDNVTTSYFIVSEKTLVKLGLNGDINLTDPALPYSDMQSQIRYHQGRWQITDGGVSSSTFGTWHKLLSQEETKLEPQQIFKLGSAVSIQFVNKAQLNQHRYN